MSQYLIFASSKYLTMLYYIHWIRNMSLYFILHDLYNVLHVKQDFSNQEFICLRQRFYVQKFWSTWKHDCWSLPLICFLPWWLPCHGARWGAGTPWSALGRLWGTWPADWCCPWCSNNNWLITIDTWFTITGVHRSL